MESTETPGPSTIDDWFTTDSCWDLILDPCTFPLRRENHVDIATSGQEYKVSLALALKPPEASILDRVPLQPSTSAVTPVSKTTCVSDDVEVQSYKAGQFNPYLDRPSQASHGQGYGSTAQPPKARRGRRDMKSSSQDHWEQYRSIIKRLYLDEEKCLEEVMQYMREQFEFSEKKPAYKRMLRRWGISKNVPAPDMDIIAAKARKRKAVEGKDTHFYVHERLLDPSKLVRFNGRKPVKHKDSIAAGAATPPYVRYVTPPFKSSSPTQLLSSYDTNNSFSDDRSSMAQTPRSSHMVESMDRECLQDPVNYELPIPSIEFPTQDFDIAVWECASYDETVTQLLPDGLDKKILENCLPPQNKAHQHILPLIPRLPCGIFKPPMHSESVTQQVTNRTMPGDATVRDKESTGNFNSTIPQTCRGWPSTVCSEEILTQRQKESMLSTVAALENVKDMILYHYGPENEIFLQQSLGLGLLYQKLSIPLKCDKVIADLGTGYGKFCLPVDSLQWTEDDWGNSRLPFSEYTCCAEPILEHCTCDQLREMARQNRARMLQRAFVSLQSRAIACYLSSGRIGQAVDSLLDLEDMFDTLAMDAYLQSIFELLETYSVDYLHHHRLVPFMRRAFSAGNHKVLSERLHNASYKLWKSQKIPLGAHLRLLTCNPHLHGSNILAITEEQLVHRIERSNGNDFQAQMHVMRDVQAFANHYQEHRQDDMADAFVLRVWEKCKNSWGFYNSETLRAQQLMRGARAEELPQALLALGLYDGAMVFDRSFG
ncbi:hypothetical protein MMC26_003890 [Xylographa opegraphella]|nr:hypothetical protein [Xylographa opegraphella]